MNTFPDDTKVGDLFWISDEPVRVTAWNYEGKNNNNRYFDIEFIDLVTNNMPAASMILIPMGFDFYGCEIRRMTLLEMELL